MKRREFLAKTATTAAGTALGADAIGKALEQITPMTSTTVGSNTSNAGSVLSLPKGGGAVKGIGETFQPNPFTGAGNFSVPIYTSPGRSGMQPQLALQYSTGQGNGSFGLGWGLSVPGISRKTEKGIPSYDDSEDTFVLSGAEDLVPYFKNDSHHIRTEQLNGDEWQVYRYRPRVEGLHALIEFWKPGNLNQQSIRSFWRVVTKDNLTSIYGCSENAKFIVPDGKGKIFEWRLELTFDAKGNAIWYQYKKDYGLDSKTQRIPVFEKHRYLNKDKKSKPCFQLYLSSIHYGNLTAFKGNYHEKLTKEEGRFQNGDFLFTVSFDYGEFRESNPISNERDHHHEYVSDDCYLHQNSWINRSDVFSNYRAGFEIRTYRYCQRVLMFHQVPAYNHPILVRSTDFHYEPNKYNDIQMLTKVVQRGYRRLEDGLIHRSEEVYLGRKGVVSNQYAIKSFPPISFQYSAFNPSQQHFQAIRGTDGDMPDKALTHPEYALVDLFGTGLPDVVHTSPAGMYYWKNKGEGQFDMRRSLRSIPNNVRLGQAGIGFGDMAGNGQADLLVHAGTRWGYFEADGSGGWKNFKYYKRQPSFDINSPQTRLMDWDGSGKAGALTTTNGSFVYFPCKGEEGFDEPQRIRRKRDLELFPDVDFSDPRVRLADMTGDGLNDIVLIHHGRIDYWANLGHGKFSRRITMENAPRLPYNAQPNQVLLLDIDGSGTTDLVYMEHDELRFCFNQSGNRFSEGYTIKGVPMLTNPANIVVADMLGNGTNGLLLTRDYPAVGRSNYHFLDFSGGTKPNLLIEMSNSMGATTKVSYRPSTYYFLKDEKDRGRNKWRSTLPFPVQCVDRVEQVDQLSGTLLVTRYAYHHGYYDGKEREFRGFALVEQFDTETIEQYQSKTTFEPQAAKNQTVEYRLPEVVTKTWFHTGAYQIETLRKKVQNLNSGTRQLNLHELFRPDYFQGDASAFTVSPARIETKGTRMDTYSISEAWRTMRGAVLRKEVYAKDNSPKAIIPYTVEEASYGIQLLQPKGDNKHGVYQMLTQENLQYHYERVIDNPRINQEVTLQTDQYGNATRTVSIAYPSKNTTAHADQRKLYASIIETYFIQANEQDFSYLYHSIPYRTCVYELLGLANQADNEIQYFTIDKLQELLLEGLPTVSHSTDSSSWPGALSKRRLSQQLTYFKKSAKAEVIEIAPGDTPIRAFEAKLPLGEIDALGLPYETYQMAFEEEILENHFGVHLSQADRHFLLLRGGYIQIPEQDSDNNFWWAASGQQSFNNKQFYLPTQSVDPWGYDTKTTYDDYHLLPVRSVDSLNNSIIVQNDYITLQAAQIRDENHNGAKVAFDALGLVQATATMGKLDENFQPIGVREGDYLENFQTLWEYDERYHNYIDNPYTQNTIELAEDSTSVMLYDLWRNIRLGKDAPPAVWSASREVHSVKNTNFQQAILYFDALGRELQTKQEVDPDRQDSSQSRRWLTSGWKIYNNKGLVVRQYEPFYTDTPLYEASRLQGCSSTLFYDPLGRAICTIHPNHTYEKVVFDPWSQTTWDVNDTVDLHPAQDEDTAPYVSSFLDNYQHCLDGQSYKTWKEECLNSGDEKKIKTLRDTLKHAETPTTTLLNVLGQSFLVLARNGQEIHRTYSNLDIQDNEQYIIDARQIELTTPTKTFEHKFDMLQRKIVVDSMDAGVKKMLPDINGEPLWSNDANGNIMIYQYDPLRRNTELWVQELGEGAYKLKEATLYGNSDQDIAINLRNKPLKIYDGAGLVETKGCDFKGNTLRSTRQVVRIDLGGHVNWASVTNGILPGQVSINGGLLNSNQIFTSTNVYDAQNRIVETQLPDGSTVKQFTYNKLGQLFSVQAKWQDGDGEKQQLFVKRIDYNPKGQRSYIQYCANDGEASVSTSYTYDDETYRLQQLTSRRTLDGSVLQDINYTYDPVGNITFIKDDAVLTVWSCKQKVDGLSYYQYDALYRLTLATGREHKGISRDDTEIIRFKQKQGIPLPPPCTDRKALRWYTETYNYDRAGNLLEKRHYQRLPNNSGEIGGMAYWKVIQAYEEDSNRRQTATSGNQSTTYQHDANGNIINLKMGSEWNYANELISIKLDASGNHAYYYYDLSGNRTLKYRTDNNSTRTYLGDYEIYGRTNTDGRGTIHIMDDQSRIALLEIGTNTDGARKDVSRVRYQISNHLGSSTVEVDNTHGAVLISLEEYLPYGGTSISFEGAVGYGAKRYRYSGKERDEESGLYYYGARYYAPWVGRWVSCDPAGTIDGLNLYKGFTNNPIFFMDTQGTSVEPGEVMMAPIRIHVNKGHSPTETSDVAYRTTDPDSPENLEGHIPESELNEIEFPTHPEYDTLGSAKDSDDSGRVIMLNDDPTWNGSLSRFIRSFEAELSGEMDLGDRPVMLDNTRPLTIRDLENAKRADESIDILKALTKTGVVGAASFTAVKFKMGDDKKAAAAAKLSKAIMGFRTRGIKTPARFILKIPRETAPLGKLGQKVNQGPMKTQNTAGGHSNPPEKPRLPLSSHSQSLTSKRQTMSTPPPQFQPRVPMQKKGKPFNSNQLRAPKDRKVYDRTRIRPFFKP